MAKIVKHKFVSAIPDGADTGLVRPSNWNDDHDVTGVAESGANSDITSLTGITGGISSPDYIAFDTTYATTLTEGQLGWDGNNTLAIGMAGGNVIQHIGEDSYFYYKATSAVTKGQVVMFTGAVGASGVPTGAPATGITDGTYIMGIAAESVALNGFGLVQCFGELKNVNTSGYADGDILWYDPTVTGGLTKTKPSAPNVKVQMAAVINGGSAGGGTILIRIDPGSTLGGTDSNAQITSPTNGNILTYDGGNGYWKNTDLVAGTNVTINKSVNGVLTINASGSGGGVTSVTGTAPVVSSGGTTPAISMAKATTSVDGYLAATDFTTFNNKGNGTVTSVSALTLGTTGTDLSSTVATGTTTPVITLNVPTASATNRGALSSADWTTFNNKGDGTVTSVSGTGTVNGITLTGTVTSSGNLTLGGTLSGVSLTTQVSGTLPIANGGTGATTAPAANAALTGFTSTATAGGTTTLTNTSSTYQVFTGTAAQTVQLPATSTLATGWSFHIVNNSTNILTVQTSTAVVLDALSPGSTLMPTVLSTAGNTAADWEVGYTDLSTDTRQIPQNAQTGNYTLDTTDLGKHIYHASGAGAAVYTIPANSAVPFEIGTTFTFINMSTTAPTIAITTDTMYLAGTGTTGTRTLAQYGMATAIKMTATTWMISGSGLT